jgi:hypothetical protein
MPIPKPTTYRPTMNIAIFCAADWITMPTKLIVAAQKRLTRRPRRSHMGPFTKPAKALLTVGPLFLGAFSAERASIVALSSCHFLASCHPSVLDGPNSECTSSTTSFSWLKNGAFRPLGHGRRRSTDRGWTGLSMALLPFRRRRNIELL